MLSKSLSIRPFLGTVNYNESRFFYQKIGFGEVIITPNLSLFTKGNLAFYLQDYYVKEWIENTMLFLEVENVESFKTEIDQLELREQFTSVKISDLQHQDWGNQFYIHDPAGNLWIVATFKPA
jgi:hypothetical protein